MKIYEIDEQILNLVDEETGEIKDVEAFNQLQMEKDKKVENLCLWYKDLVAEAKAIKEEKLALGERQKQTENKAESVKNFIDYILSGDKFKTSKVAVSYRKSQSVSVDSDFVKWAQENADDLLTYSEPKASLTAIKEALLQGRDVQHAEILENKNISIK